MKLINNWTIISVALLIPMLSLQAQYSGYFSYRDSLWVHQMDSVFVEGNQPPGLSSLVRTTVPQERIEAMAYRDLNEIITGEVAGFFGSQKGVMGYGVAGGSAGKLSFRGHGGNPTTGLLIAQNGKPEIMGLMGHPVPDAYSADVVGEVEVIKGAASILYGTNAIGGVVNMKTKRVMSDGFTTRIRMARGNFNVKRLVIQNGGKFDRWDYYLTFGQRSTIGHRPHSAFSSKAYHVRLGYEVRPNLSLSLVGKAVPLHMEDPGREGGDTGLAYDIVRGDLTLSARLNLSRLKLNYQVFHNQGEHEISDGFHSTDFCDGLILKHHLYFLQGNSTTIGVDYKQYGGKLIQVFKPTLVGKRFDVRETALYILSEQTIKQIKISAGLRGENHSVYGWVTVPHVGISVNVSPALTFYGSHGEGFRSPTIRELYLFPAPNEQLKPEESVTTEIGTTYELGSNLTVTGDYYITTGVNRIETLGAWPNLELRNSGEFNYHGIEANLKYLPFRGMQVAFNGSVFYADDPVANQPGSQMRISVSYHRKYYTMRGNVDYVEGLQYFERGSYKTLPDYTLINIGLEAVPINHVNIFVQVKNLADVEYLTMAGYPMPGRTLEGGVIFDF